MQVRLDEIVIDSPKVPQSLAMEEFQKWLDYKKTKVKLTMTGSDVEPADNKADNKAEMAIVESIMAGDLVINEDMTMDYKLSFPIKNDSGSVELSSLSLKPRLTAFEVQKATKGINTDEPFKLFTGYIHVLSGEVRGIINKLDSLDFSLLQKIVGYFL